MKYDLIAYAIDFTSFLVQKSKNMGRIRNIILFGSVSRFEADKNSDIDLFIDVVNNEEEIEQESHKILKGFYSSVKFMNYWGLLHIKNKFKLSFGDINKWELKNSIISNGITLYGKYRSLPAKGKHAVLFSFENIQPNPKRVMLNKKIFGYSHSGKRYKGLLEEYGGTRLSKGTVLVPVEHTIIFMKVFRDFRIAVKIKKIIDYS